MPNYSGKWKLPTVMQAVGAGNWPTPPLGIGRQLWVWGNNNNGALGTSNTTTYSSPVQVGALTDWYETVSGYLTGFGLKADGTLWSWGQNNYGQLGLGTTTYYSSPVQVGALTTWSSLGGSYYQTAVIKGDGTLWTWGRGTYYGALGLGNTTNYSSPKQVGALTDWAQASCGTWCTLVVKTDGTLWGFGRNNQGQLGVGNTTDYSSPVQVGALTDWAVIYMRSFQATALKTDGTIWTWGANTTGAGGQSNTTKYSSPVQVGALTTWATIGPGSETDLDNSAWVMAIKTDGTLWAWGEGSDGQLGLGNSTNYSSPKQVGALTTWSKVTGARKSSYGIKTDGTMWVWGDGSDGALGRGDTTSFDSPVQLGSLTTWVSTGSQNFHTGVQGLLPA